MNEKLEDAEARDAALLSALASAVAAVEPPPEGWRAFAEGAFAWRTIDAELAALVYDSAEHQGELVGVRGASQPRHLTFETPEVVVEVEVRTGAGGGVTGQLAPAGPGRVELSTLEGTVVTEADDVGRFRFPAIAPGPLRFRCHRAAGAPIETVWLRV